ncbi:DUF4168 domain-containing protein [Desulfonatronospira sp. MSAO_Bac3]|uniref:DUF4168 domain-containing protein n=1 Tax=Desulfonatronospira sp. MSAO_Bac3 TaxID=2293857 RepID=UPI00257A737C|nr:DUF4168 domain-containing protein [Desulfonatronospira sp. MSAO_Bac3]
MQDGKNFMGSDIGESEMDKVAEAYKSIKSIKENVHKELTALNDSDETLQKLEKAGEDMVRAVEQQGLDFETYNEAMEAVKTDDELRRSLNKRLQSSGEH